MNKDNAKDYLPLVQALADGKTIQFCYNEVDWADDPAPAFGAWPADRFRIKPEPKVVYVVLNAAEVPLAVFNKESVARGLVDTGSRLTHKKFVEEL